MSTLPQDRCRGLFGLIAIIALAGLGVLPAPEAAGADPARPSSGLSITLGRSDGPADAAEPGGDDTPAYLRRLEAAIDNLDCSRLRLVELPGSGTVELRGHVPTAELAADLIRSSQRLAGDDTLLVGNLMILPSPQCGVLDAVEAMGLTQSDDQWNDPLAVGEQARADMPRALDGEVAAFRFQAPEYDAHIYIDYFDAAGVVQHLMPSDFRGENRFRANAVFGIGDTIHDPQLVFTAPLGIDIVLAIATTEPLYGGRRPFMENAEVYLDWLADRVRDGQRETPDFRAEWAFMLILTESG